MESAAQPVATTCQELHCDEECGAWSEVSDLLQTVFTQVTGDITDWMKCRLEPWVTLSGALHGQII